MCKHKYQKLDVEKRVDKEARYSNTYHRTTRLFCELCTDVQEIKEELNIGINENRPDWTYNL
ncbi:hypothetical protein [Tenacibaculum sp. Bg11-29]|uniref:hypothetical protein n=1 Tax=Tenacibaculum sp. Bg11-29 TaxID=2058306 RepID=UPI0012FEAFC5|nr:hypothetical protein [Tenacibaculum sp. Bg11-29]